MLRLVSSLRLFFALCALLAAAFLWQTLVNKGAPVYGSAWFAALGVALAANIAACAASRRRSAPAWYLLLHSGLVVVIAGAFLTRYFRFEAELPLRKGAPSDTAYADDGAYRLPFSLELLDFRVDYHGEPRGVLSAAGEGWTRELEAKEGAAFELPGRGVRLKVLRTVRDFGLSGKKVFDKSPYWHNPAVQAEVSAGGRTATAWVFANFPGMGREDLPLTLAYRVEGAEVRDYASSVYLRARDFEAQKKEISVNSPLRVMGYSLYQTSFDPADPAYTLLTVTRDRGAWAVFAGFALLLAGVALWLRK